MYRITMAAAAVLLLAGCSAAPVDLFPATFAGKGDNETDTVIRSKVSAAGGDYYIRVVAENPSDAWCTFAIGALGSTLTGQVAPRDRYIHTEDVSIRTGVYDALVSSGCDWSVSIARSW